MQTAGGQESATLRQARGTATTGRPPGPGRYAKQSGDHRSSIVGGSSQLHSKRLDERDERVAFDGSQLGECVSRRASLATVPKHGLVNAAGTAVVKERLPAIACLGAADRPERRRAPHAAIG